MFPDVAVLLGGAKAKVAADWSYFHTNFRSGRFRAPESSKSQGS